jgi:biuret amidohydrolase
MPLLSSASPWKSGLNPQCGTALIWVNIPVVVTDACGFGHRDAAARSVASLEFAGDALLTNVETMCAHFGRIRSQEEAVRA